VEHRIVRQRLTGPEPDLLLDRDTGPTPDPVGRHVPQVPVRPLAELPRHLLRSERRCVAQLLGIRHRRHDVLVLDALVQDVERRRHREDRLPVLHGGHPAGDERPAVANPVDEVDDRHDGVAGTQKVPVQ